MKTKRGRQRLGSHLRSAGLIGGLVALGLGPAASAQTLDEVLQRHYDARGGLAELEALMALETSGTASTGDRETVFKQYFKRPGSFRIEALTQGQQIVGAYDGETAWSTDPSIDGGKPRLLPADQARALALQADIDGLLVNHLAEGTSLELLGKEKIDGRRTFKIGAKLRSGLALTIYVDAKTYLERRIEGEVGIGTGALQMDISAWHEVDGLKFIADQTTKVAGTETAYRYDPPVVNGAVADELFMMPGQTADDSLNVDQVLSRHLAARVRPGTEKITTVKATGSLVLMGFTVPLEMLFARPSACRLNADMAGTQMVLAYDGETAWTVSPMQGIGEPEALPADAAEAVALFSDFLWGLLRDHRERGFELELRGVERVGRHETYHLRVVTEGGLTRDIYLGGEDFLEHKISVNAVFLGVEQAIDALLGDYQDSSGLMVPRDIQLLAEGSALATVRLQEVTTNVDIDPQVFALPAVQPADPAR